jgi:diguanylate cyclase (GGDEF)-like protein
MVSPVSPLPPAIDAARADSAMASQPWAALVQGLPDATWIVDGASLRVVACNSAAAQLLALPASQLLGQRADALIGSPEDLAFWDAAAAGESEPLWSDTQLSTHDGRTVHVSRSIRALGALGALGTGGGAPSHYAVVVHDRSAFKQAEDQREQVLAELQATLESTADGILVTDLVGRIRVFNRRFAQIWGIPEDLLRARDDAAVGDWMRRSVPDAEAYQRRLRSIQDATLLNASDRLTLHSGQVLERVTRPLWCRGQAMGRVYSFRDLSEQLAADHRIEELSLTDALTGLPNRRQLVDKVAKASARARREAGGFALLLVDLDRFRQINDSLGHETGDRVLIDVAQRIKSCMRTDDVLARIGGDQFALVVQGADSECAERSARRVLDAVAAPYNLDGAQFTLTCSIGGALCPANGHGADDLVRHAEAAVLAAKHSGRASYRAQQGRRGGDRRADIQLEHSMRQALASGRFRLHYQPQVELRSGSVVGAEALIRWRDPALGEVSPARFIPVAEDSGFIIALGDWVLAQAVRQAAAWHALKLAVPVAVNVSALQFQQPRFVDRVAAVLAASGLPPQRLELELTESILVRDADEALHRLQALARIGVRLSIDDFGTGYSSLAYLKRFPIGKLKIDRSFIKGLPGDDSDAAIVVAILQMARALGMKVIAEGVETDGQRQFLADSGCDEFQGFLFAPALDSLSFEKRLRASRELPEPVRPRRVQLVRG